MSMRNLLIAATLIAVVPGTAAIAQQTRVTTTVTTEAPAEVDTTNTEEAPVTDTATDTPTEVQDTEVPTETPGETPDEGTDEPTPDDQPAETGNTENTGKKEEPVDLSAFTSAVEAAIENADESTGTVPEADLAKVTEEFRNLSGAKPKNAAKKFVNEALRSAMNEDSIPRARAAMKISDLALTAGPASKAGPKEPADPTEALVQRMSILSLAYVLASAHPAEGVAEDFNDKVVAKVTEADEQSEQFYAWTTGDEETRGEEPDVPTWVKSAVKLSLGKAAKVGGAGRGVSSVAPGERGDTLLHIRNAFADKPVGTFMKVGEIQKVKSDTYGDRLPSAGAIVARLFPPSGGESKVVRFGLTPCEQDGKKGARKDAESDSNTDSDSDDDE